uniref:Uncharacterized protein n=1 Tax=Heterosigma akashiwo TaxID=2829 RepID=A0A7S4DLI1_HETAK
MRRPGTGRRRRPAGSAHRGTLHKGPTRLQRSGSSAPAFQDTRKSIQVQRDYLDHVRRPAGALSGGRGGTRSVAAGTPRALSSRGPRQQRRGEDRPRSAAAAAVAAPTPSPALPLRQRKVSAPAAAAAAAAETLAGVAGRRLPVPGLVVQRRPAAPYEVLVAPLAGTAAPRDRVGEAEGPQQRLGIAEAAARRSRPAAAAMRTGGGGGGGGSSGAALASSSVYDQQTSSFLLSDVSGPNLSYVSSCLSPPLGGPQDNYYQHMEPAEDFGVIKNQHAAASKTNGNKRTVQREASYYPQTYDCNNQSLGEKETMPKPFISLVATKVDLHGKDDPPLLSPAPNLDSPPGGKHMGANEATDGRWEKQEEKFFAFECSK